MSTPAGYNVTQRQHVWGSPLSKYRGNYSITIVIMSLYPAMFGSTATGPHALDAG